MPYPKTPVLVHYGNWNDETRAHPAMKWMEHYTRNIFDGRTFDQGVPASEHYTSDMVLQKSDGTKINGANEAWKMDAEMYAPFAAHKHIPEFLVCWDTEDGWAMTGVAHMYFRLKGLDEQGPVVDPESNEKWHGASPGAFGFAYVKDKSGSIKMKEKRIYAYPTALKTMLQHKLIDAEQLAGIVIGS